MKISSPTVNDLSQEWAKEFKAGIEARMPDDLPVFGRSARHEGVYHQFGFSAHGFQLGPGAGAVMAEIIATGSSNVPIDGLGIARFAASAQP